MTNPNITYRTIVYCNNCIAATKSSVPNKFNCCLHPREVFVFKEGVEYKIISSFPEMNEGDFCLDGQVKVQSELVK